MTRLIGLAFCAVADLLATYETTRDSWHIAAINGHTNFGKFFPLTIAEGRNLYTVSLLLDVDYLTGLLTTNENRALMDKLTLFLQLQYKFCLLIRKLWRTPVTDKFLSLTTMASSLLLGQKLQSDLQRKQQQHLLHKTIQIPLSYVTRQRDWITLPQRVTFINAYKVPCPFCPTKQRKLCLKSWKEQYGCKSKLLNQAKYRIPEITVARSTAGAR